MQHRRGWTGPAFLMMTLAACGGPQPATTSQTGQPQLAAGAAGPPLATKNMPPVAGQQKTCAGPREKTFDLDVIETAAVHVNPGDLVRMYFVNVGPGVSAAHVIGTVFDRVSAGAP